MAAGQNDGLFEFSKFKGLRNNTTSRDFEVGDLEAASNVDIDDAQRITRRKGYGSAVVAGATTSLWSNGTTALAVNASNALIRILPDYSTATLRTGLAPGRSMSYASVGQRVYFSNTVDTGVVEPSRVRSWGLAVPIRQPDAAAIGGVLPAGRYQFAVTYLRDDGQESGSQVPNVVELSATGGISLSAIPVPTDSTVALKAVYFTKCNGDTLYRAGTLPVGTTTFTYQMESSMQVPLTTAHLRPPPAGQLVDTITGGRSLVARDSLLFYSEPYDLERFDLRKNVASDSRVTMVAALDTGVFLGTENEVSWLQGNVPEKWDRDPKIAYGVIPGAYAICSRDMVLDGGGSRPCVVFASAQGYCIGEDGGNIVNITQDRFSWPLQERGALLIRRHRGVVQAVASLQGTEGISNVSA